MLKSITLTLLVVMAIDIDFAVVQTRKLLTLIRD